VAAVAAICGFLFQWSRTDMGMMPAGPVRSRCSLRYARMPVALANSRAAKPEFKSRSFCGSFMDLRKSTPSKEWRDPTPSYSSVGEGLVHVIICLIKARVEEVGPECVECLAA